MLIYLFFFSLIFFFFFFFNATATTEIYTLSLHDALPIFHRAHPAVVAPEDAYALAGRELPQAHRGVGAARDREAARDVEGHRAHLALVAEEVAQVLRRRDVPHPGPRAAGASRRVPPHEGLGFLQVGLRGGAPEAAGGERAAGGAQAQRVADGRARELGVEEARVERVAGSGRIEGLDREGGHA